MSAQFSSYANRLEVVYLAGMSLDRVLDEVGRLSRDTIVVFLTMQQDREGVRHVRMDDMLAEIAAASSVPAYGVYETYVGPPTIAGLPFRPPFATVR